MAKRNNRIDTEVIALAVTGLSQRAIAEKLEVKFMQQQKVNHECTQCRHIRKPQVQ